MTRSQRILKNHLQIARNAGRPYRYPPCLADLRDQRAERLNKIRREDTGWEEDIVTRTRALRKEEETY